MSDKKPTTLGTKVVVVIIVGFFLLIIKGSLDPVQHNVSQPPIQQTMASEPVAKQPVEAKWVQPRIYPGVKLYYSHDGKQMQFIGTIFDAVGIETAAGERTFGITMASGNREYKLREILWEGHWFMDRVQGQKAKDEFSAL